MDGSAPSPLWEQSAPSPAPSPVLPRVCRRSPRVLILANLPRKAPGGDFCGARGWPQTPGWPFTGRRGRWWDPRPEPSRSLLKKTRRGSEPGLQGFRGRSAGCSRRHPLGRDRGLRVEVTSLSRCSQRRALAEKKEPGFCVSEMPVSTRSPHRGFCAPSAQPHFAKCTCDLRWWGSCFACDLNKTPVVGGSGTRGAAGFSFP